MGADKTGAQVPEERHTFHVVKGLHQGQKLYVQHIIHIKPGSDSRVKGFHGVPLDKRLVQVLGLLQCITRCAWLKKCTDACKIE